LLKPAKIRLVLSILKYQPVRGIAVGEVVEGREVREEHRGSCPPGLIWTGGKEWHGVIVGLLRLAYIDQGTSRGRSRSSSSVSS
jgi:hypothetical protein